MTNSLILVSITAILIIGLGIFVLARKKGQKMETDYRAFFTMGIIWLPIGIATKNPGLWGLGAVFMVAGLANRDKWKEEPKWSDLDPDARRTKLIVIGGLTVLLLAGLVYYILANNN